VATADLTLLMYPRQASSVSDRDILTAFLQELVYRGYLILPDQNGVLLLRQRFEAKTLAPGIEPEVERDRDAFTQGQGDAFRCILRLVPEPERDYGLAFTFAAWRDGTLWVDVDDGNFKYTDEGLQNYERFIDFILTVYQFWPLHYGYLGDGPEWDAEDAKTFRPDELHEITILGPEYVARLGRENIRRAQVWKKIDMSDGGVILVVMVYAQYTQPDLDIHPARIARQFGWNSSQFMDEVEDEVE